MKKEEGVIYKERKRWKFTGLPFTFTVYSITEDKINIKKGLFSTVEDDCFMYKVQDVKLTKSFIERIFKLGTICCYCGDVTHPELKLVHIKNSKVIKDYLLVTSEEARRKRRTLHTMGIDAEELTEDELDID